MHWLNINIMYLNYQVLALMVQRSANQSGASWRVGVHKPVTDAELMYVVALFIVPGIEINFIPFSFIPFNFISFHSVQFHFISFHSISFHFVGITWRLLDHVFITVRFGFCLIPSFTRDTKNEKASAIITQALPSVMQIAFSDDTFSGKLLFVL